MIGQYRDLGDPLSIWDIGLWTIAGILLFALAMFTFYRLAFHENEITKLQKINTFTWALSFILLVFSIVLCLLWKYLIKDELLSSIADITVVSLVNIGIIIKIVQIEYFINQYKFYKGYYFSFVALGLFLFTAFFQPSKLRELGVFQAIYLILFLASVSVFAFIFLYMAVKLKGSERRMALWILLGVEFLGAGFMFQPQNMEAYKEILINYEVLHVTAIILCPICVIIGTLIVFSSYINNLK